MAFTRKPRREALSFSARAVLAGLFFGLAPSFSLSAEENKHAGHRFQLGVCDWTAGKRADPAALDVAKRAGLDGIMALMDYSPGPSPLLSPDRQKQYRTMAAKLEMGIGGLSLGALSPVPYKSDPRAQQWVADSIEVSRGIGTKIVLVPFFGDAADLKNDRKGTEAVIQRFKEIAPQAE